MNRVESGRSMFTLVTTSDSNGWIHGFIIDLHSSPAKRSQGSADGLQVGCSRLGVSQIAVVSPRILEDFNLTVPSLETGELDSKKMGRDIDRAVCCGQDSFVDRNYIRGIDLERGDREWLRHGCHNQVLFRELSAEIPRTRVGLLAIDGARRTTQLGAIVRRAGVLGR